jgi:molecular chaperone HtpG
MTSPARRQEGNTAHLDPEVIRVGADIVELLTSGMYVSPITIFREYVQNAADAIDLARSAGLLTPRERGKVQIEIDHPNRSVTIRDNGAGLPAAQAADVLLAIGGSAKRGTTARGFRGVGRLSGLAYCRELTFRTKAAGEPVETVVTWDALALRKSIASAPSATDVREVVASSVFVESSPAVDLNAHFFEVTLYGVIRHRQDLLINEHAIAHYLSQVAPVPFSPEFSFGTKIADMLSAADHATPPIDLTVGTQLIFRPHRDTIRQPGTDKFFNISEVEFFELLDVDGNVGAVGWLGHHEYLRSISVTLGVRGLRARIGDTQIGESDIFDQSFREPRFNGWTVGELHVLDRRILPNGRRDNFEVNHHSNNLLVQLGTLTANISHRCRTSSITRNSTMIIRNTIGDIDLLLTKERIDSASLSRAQASINRAFHKVRGVADISIATELSLELTRLREALFAMRQSENAGVIASDVAISLVNKYVTSRDQAAKLIEALRTLQA